MEYAGKLHGQTLCLRLRRFVCEYDLIMRAGGTLGGRYVLEQLLGKGGMGAVWSAYDEQMQQRVAVKLILPQIEEELTKELRQRLLREAGACAKLQHPNIIQVFDVGQTEDEHPYLVLELLDGQALGDVLKQKRRLEPKLAARIAADIASGLAEAHAAKVIHRDLKPANIYLHREAGMAQDDFVVKVLDFGVCIDRESMDTVKTRAGIIVGSPAYMSPEQVAVRKDIDGRTDIWSLGVLLYEMITGQRAFNGNVQNVMAQIITQPVPAPSSKVRDVPPDLDAVVARCTQMRKELRYEEASELARDLYLIAGARPLVRHASASRPSLVKQIGLADMFDAEIHATPAVPKPGDLRTFNPVGATLPLIAPQKRVESEKLPPVLEEDDDLAATLPLQPKLLAALRPKPMPESPAEAPHAALGTQFFELKPNEKAPSPEPAWKREMEQALEVHRQSSLSLSAAALPAQAQALEDVGGTLLLPAKKPVTLRTDTPLRLDATGTTSMAGTLSREIPSSAIVPQDIAGVTGRRKRSSRLLYGAAGFVGATIVLLVGVLGYRQFLNNSGGFAVAPPEIPPSANSPSPPMPNVASSAAPTEPPGEPLPPTSAFAVGTAAPTPETPPGATTNVVPPATVPPVSSATTPPTKSSASSAPKGVVGGPLKKAPQPVLKVVCTGVGIFQNCKKVPVQ